MIVQATIAVLSNTQAIQKFVNVTAKRLERPCGAEVI